MAKSNRYSKKEFLNLCSGQTFYYITKDQLGEIRIEKRTAIGKPVIVGKLGTLFETKEKIKTIFISSKMYENSIVIFKTLKAAKKFAAEVFDSIHQDENVVNIIRRIKKVSES